MKKKFDIILLLIILLLGIANPIKINADPLFTFSKLITAMLRFDNLNGLAFYIKEHSMPTGIYERPKLNCEICGISNKDYRVSNSKKLGMVICRRHYKQFIKYGKTIDRTNREQNKIIKYKNYAEMVLYDKVYNEVGRVKIDLDDVEKLRKTRWSLKKTLTSSSVRSSKLGVQSRLIMNCPKGKLVDHRNHDTLDNRKENLRICTHKENMQNRISDKNSFSIYKGVYKTCTKNLFESSIGVNNKKIALGYFKTEVEAALEYNKAAKKYFGEFAYLNKIER